MEYEAIKTFYDLLKYEFCTECVRIQIAINKVLYTVLVELGKFSVANSKLILIPGKFLPLSILRVRSVCLTRNDRRKTGVRLTGCAECVQAQPTVSTTAKIWNFVSRFEVCIFNYGLVTFYFRKFVL